MTDGLRFKDEAVTGWRKLGKLLQDQFKKKLAERLETLHVPASRLYGSTPNKPRYKIKARQAGYRLVYEVRDQEVVVVVIAVGKRDRNAVYKAADRR